MRLKVDRVWVLFSSFELRRFRSENEKQKQHYQERFRRKSEKGRSEVGWQPTWIRAALCGRQRDILNYHQLIKFLIPVHGIPSIAIAEVAV
jgi:hypothetical protein